MCDLINNFACFKLLKNLFITFVVNFFRIAIQASCFTLSILSNVLSNGQKHLPAAVHRAQLETLTFNISWTNLHKLNQVLLANALQTKVDKVQTALRNPESFNTVDATLDLRYRHYYSALFSALEGSGSGNH